RRAPAGRDLATTRVPAGVRRAGIRHPARTDCAGSRLARRAALAVPWWPAPDDAHRLHRRGRGPAAGRGGADRLPPAHAAARTRPGSANPGADCPRRHRSADESAPARGRVAGRGPHAPVRAPPARRIYDTAQRKPRRHLTATLTVTIRPIRIVLPVSYGHDAIELGHVLPARARAY